MAGLLNLLNRPQNQQPPQTELPPDTDLPQAVHHNIPPYVPQPHSLPSPHFAPPMPPPPYAVPFHGPPPVHPVMPPFFPPPHQTPAHFLPPGHANPLLLLLNSQAAATTRHASPPPVQSNLNVLDPMTSSSIAQSPPRPTADDLPPTFDAPANAATEQSRLESTGKNLLNALLGVVTGAEEEIKKTSQPSSPRQQTPVASNAENIDASNATEHLKMALFGASHPPVSTSDSAGETATSGASQKESPKKLDAKKEQVEKISAPSEEVIKEPSKSVTQKPKFSYVNPFEIMASSSIMKSGSSKTSSASSVPSSVPSSEESTKQKNEDQEVTKVAQPPYDEIPPSESQTTEHQMSKVHHPQSVESSTKSAMEIRQDYPRNEERGRQGARLPPTRFAIDVTAPNADAITTRDPGTTVYALVPTEVEYRTGKLIAIMAPYIVSYAVKGGKIRVIHTNYGNRVMLKQHTREILDLAFWTPPTEAQARALKELGFGKLLLSIGKDSKVIIWDLSEASADGDDIPCKAILEIVGKPTEADGSRFVRGSWHPLNPDVFVVADDQNRVLVFNIVSILNGRDQTILTEGDGFRNERGITLLEGHGKAISDMSWSQDGSVLATASEDGFVRLWSMDTTASSVEPICRYAAHPGEPASFVTFVADMPGHASRYMIVAHARGTKITLWDMMANRPAHVMELTLPKGSGDAGDHYALLAYDQRSSTLQIYNSLRRSVYLVHLRFPISAHETRVSRQSDYVTSVLKNRSTEVGQARFDHILEIPLGESVASMVSTPQFTFHPTALPIELSIVGAKAIRCLTIDPQYLCPAGYGDLSGCPLVQTLERVVKSAEPSLLASGVKEVSLQPPHHPPKWLGAVDSTVSPRSTVPETEIEQRKSHAVQEDLYTNKKPKDKGETEAPTQIKLSGPVVNGMIAKLKEKKKGGKADEKTNNNKKNGGQEQGTLSESPVSEKTLASEKPHQRASVAVDSEVKSINERPVAAESQLFGTLKTSGPTPNLAANGLTVVQSEALTKELKQIESNISSKVGRLVAKEMDKQSERFERERLAQEKLNAVRHESMLKVVSQTLTNNLSELLEKTVRAEMQTTVSSSMGRMVNNSVDKHLGKSLGDAIHKILPGAVDKSLTDGIQRTLSKPAVVDHLSKGIASSMQPVINEGFRNAFKDVLIPGFQRATTAMFEQIHASFENGVVQLLQQTSTAHGTNPVQLQRLQSTLDGISSQLGSLQTSLSGPAFNQYMSQASAELEQKLARSLSGELKRILAIEDGSGPLGSASRRSSHASMTSNEPENVTREVLRLVSMGEYDQAFTKALASSDLSIVNRLCSTISASTVFLPGKTLLSQPVILSLLHQLSMELEKGTDMKLGWIQESLMALTPKDLLVADHAQRILPVLKRRLEQTYYNLASTDPKPLPILQSLKFILHVIPTMMSD